MGLSREKKLRQELRSLRASLDDEIRMHQDTLAVLDALRRVAKPTMGKMLWLESCIDIYRDYVTRGLIQEGF